MLLILTFSAAVGSGLMSGLFFVFSNSVMKALSQLPAPQGIAAMQAINRTILNPLFLGIFIGTAALSVFLIFNALLQWFATDPGWMLAGGLSYFGGTFLVTVGFNVPWNDKLAAADPDNLESAELWTEYLSKWTAWNHVRTIGALGAAIAFIIALL